MGYLGDMDPGQDVYCFFNTRKADGTPITLVGGTVAVYKDFSTTESTTGVVLNTDYDSRTGLHKIVISTFLDLTFYGGPRDYAITLTAGTVNGVSVVGVVVGTFSVDNRSPLRPSVAGRTVAVDGSGNVSVASVPSVNVSSINSISTSSVTTIAANLGTTQPINFTGFGGLAKPQVDVKAWASQTSGIDYSTLTGLPAVAVAAFYDRNNTDNTGHVAFDPTFANGGTILVDKLNTALSTVQWTNTLATNLGTLAGHDPGATLASQTNITAGTIGTVTNPVSLAEGESELIQVNLVQTPFSSTTVVIKTALGTNDVILGCRVKLLSGTGAGQERTITAYNDGTKTVTVDRAWIVTPDGTTRYAVVYDDAPRVNATLNISEVSLVDTVSGMPTAVQNADALLGRNGAGGSNGGRTVSYFLMGGMNKVDFATDGLSFTVYSTDDLTPLYTGSSTRLSTTVGGLRGVDPA